MSPARHIVIEEGRVETFTQRINEASAKGFVVIASNVAYIRHDMHGHIDYEALFYALMAKSETDDDYIPLTLMPTDIG